MAANLFNDWTRAQYRAADHALRKIRRGDASPEDWKTARSFGPLMSWHFQSAHQTGSAIASGALVRPDAATWHSAYSPTQRVHWLNYLRHMVAQRAWAQTDVRRDLFRGMLADFYPSGYGRFVRGEKER